MTYSSENPENFNNLHKKQQSDELVEKGILEEALTFDETVSPIWEVVAEISAEVPPEEWAKLPTDLASNFDDYQ